MIKLFVMDVDGTLTDGRIYVSAGGEAMKAFDVKDGYGIAHLLPKADIIPVIITGRSSEILLRRGAELNIKEVHQGVANKLEKLQEIARIYNASPAEIAYIGDDLNDQECIRFCGYTACPADAVAAVADCVDYVCKRPGGRGAVREFIDLILAQCCK